MGIWTPTVYEWKPDEFKKNFVGFILRQYFEKHKDVTHASIYRQVGISRQQFQNDISLDKCVAPTRWVAYRKALGISKKKFWEEAKNFFDADD